MQSRSVFLKRSGIPLAVLLIIFLFYDSAMLHTLKGFKGNYSGFVRFKERRLERLPFLENRKDIKKGLIIKKQGYDGQFYYNMTYDPFLRHLKRRNDYREVVDSPRYRYGRIGFSWLTMLFSFSRPELFPKTMVFLILAFHLVGAFFFLKIILFLQRSPWWSLLYILVPSFITSLNLALPEPVAAALLLGGMYFYLREKFSFAFLFFAASVLVRETGIILIAVIALYEIFRKRRLKIAILMAASIVPYYLWRCYMTWRLFEEWGWSTLFFSPGDFAVPFEGIAMLYGARWYSGPAWNGLLFFPVLIVLNLIFAIILTVRRKDISSIALLSYSFIYICLSYGKIWVQIKNIERTAYEGFLLLMLAFLSLPKNSHPYLRYAIIVYFAILFYYDITLSAYVASFRAGLRLLAPFVSGG